MEKIRKAVTDRQADRQAGRQAGRQTDRQTDGTVQSCLVIAKNYTELYFLIAVNVYVPATIGAKLPADSEFSPKHQYHFFLSNFMNSLIWNNFQ